SLRQPKKVEARLVPGNFTAAPVPSDISDPVNARILAVSEDRIAGFVEEPFAEMAAATGLTEDAVIERLRAMLSAGVIRRIRQTLMATNLAPGALVAWRVPAAKKLFTLGVGHVRRPGVEPGSRSDEPGRVLDTNIVELSPLDWQVLTVLKREFNVDEIVTEPWASRAIEAGVSRDEFLRVAGSLSRRAVIGRFSTFLEHVKPSATGERVTRYN